jgi:integrase
MAIGGIIGGTFQIQLRGTAMSGGIGTRAINRLSNQRVKTFIAAAKAGKAEKKKLSDGGGLYLTITPAGSPVWRLKYRHGGKEKLYSPGVYPSVSLEEARAERDRVSRVLKEGRDPVKARKIDRATATVASDATFASVTTEWLEKQKRSWSEVHYLKSSQALERDVLPWLGSLPVGDITSGMVAEVIKPIIARGAIETASKILWNVSAIFDLARVYHQLPSNPAEPVREILPERQRQKRRPALLEFAPLGDLLRRAELANLSPAVRLAHRLCAFSAARIGNVIKAEWAELELDSNTPTWTIPRSKMKAKDRDHDHKILLGPTITGELRTWRSMTGGKGNVFPSPTGKGGTITHESLEKVYRKTLGLDGKHSPHGWRSSFSTLAKENGFNRDAVELALDHIHDNEVVRAYDRGERLDERIKIMYWWDAQLLAAQHGTEAIRFQATGAA